MVFVGQTNITTSMIVFGDVLALMLDVWGGVLATITATAAASGRALESVGSMESSTTISVS